MHRHTLSETGDMASARSSRAPSFSSDRPSVASSVTFQMPATVRPPPAYIAAAVASQTVSDHHHAQLRQTPGEGDTDDDEGEELENAVFAEPALALLNGFLDHLLFAFLSSARAPSLMAMRPAIVDVLKARLAREAMEAADEELQGLLGGDDDDDDDTPVEPPAPAVEGRLGERWDVERVWKRTRLRIMVYTRLGELEDDDEDRYVQQERGLSMDEDADDDAGLVSWAAAIFLTSVIEHVAEQALLAAGLAAFARRAARRNKLALQMPGAGREHADRERLVIDEPDVEKIALNAALGRLWRTWRKRVRSPMSPLSPGRDVRPASSYTSLHHRKASRDTIDEHVHAPVPEHTPTETEIAANIPLPQGANDVNEIEVPGLAHTYDTDVESSGTQTPVPRPQRPSSLIILAPAETFRRRTIKERPLSMPLRPAPLFSFPARNKSDAPETPFATPLERQLSNESYTDTEDADELPREEPPDPDAAMVAFAAATGMGFRMNSVDPTHTAERATVLEEPEPPSANGYESEPMVMRGKRVSIEKTGPAGLVRTFSTRSSSLRSPRETPTPTPKASIAEGRSYLDDDFSDQGGGEHHAIGIARTSDMPIRSTPTPPGESPLNKGKGSGNGGYVEVQPRHGAPISAPFRNSPTPDAKPIIPERSGARRDLHNRSPSENDFATNSTLYENTISPSHRPDAMPSKSRDASMPSLQEVDSAGSQSKQSTASEPNAPFSSPSPSSPKSSLNRLNRDTPVQLAERQIQRSLTNESTHSQPGLVETSPSDKTSLKRGASSSSSAKKSGSFTVTPNGRESGSRNLSGRMSEEDREREFDSLVKGQETVKFTLTPQSMRDLDESPLQKKVEPIKPAAPPLASVTVYPRVNAEDNFGTADLPKRTTSRGKGPTAAPAQHKPSPSRKVVTRPLAREPRVEAESMRDFADFIRSTGPSPGQEKSVQPFVNISGNGSRPANASTSSLGRKLSTNKATTRNTDSPSGKPRVNMEPRSPAGLSGGNNDLIDFIRQGPPSANTGQPRIPRNVAPFRTTVDSDQFDTMLDGHGNVESAFGSTASTLDSMNSTHTVNSRTGLIPAPNVVQPAYSNTPQQLSGSMASNQEPSITRTRRRVKDPYAIDVSDDEDDDQLTALPHSSHPGQPTQPAKQESLMDFLNGMDPPTSNKPQPFMLSEETISAARARATASNSSLSSSNIALRTGNVPPFGAASSSVASNAPRAYKPRLQARAPAIDDARGMVGRTATSDLADFLRNSGPSEPPMGSPSIMTKKEEEKKSRKFWRKKTYGDLP